jgi:hypothetical protein
VKHQQRLTQLPWQGMIRILHAWMLTDHMRIYVLLNVVLNERTADARTLGLCSRLPRAP